MSRPRLISETLTVLFLLSVAVVATKTKISYILFPELAALASEVLHRPKGKWARVPWKLIATPTITAFIGILVTARLAYGVLPILIVLGLSLGVIFTLKSAVAPAISAGVLPIVLGVTSPYYPISIFCTLTTLAAILLVWRQTADGKELSKHEGPDEKVVEILEAKPRGRLWLPALLLFTLIVGLAAQFLGWRFLLFPPLIVMAYEMLGHPDTCPWAKSPFTFPLACTLTAGAGVGLLMLLGVGPIAVALTLIVGICILRVLRLRMPPALAIGLIPFVIPAPTFRYALSVGIGSVALTLWFLTLDFTFPAEEPLSGNG